MQIFVCVLLFWEKCHRREMLTREPSTVVVVAGAAGNGTGCQRWSGQRHRYTGRHACIYIVLATYLHSAGGETCAQRWNSVLSPAAEKKLNVTDFVIWLSETQKRNASAIMRIDFSFVTSGGTNAKCNNNFPDFNLDFGSQNFSTARHTVSSSRILSDKLLNPNLLFVNSPRRATVERGLIYSSAFGSRAAKLIEAYAILFGTMNVGCAPGDGRVGHQSCKTFWNFIRVKCCLFGDARSS